MEENCHFINLSKENNGDVNAVLVFSHISDCGKYQLLLAYFFMESTVIRNEFADYLAVLNITIVWKAWNSGGSNGKPQLSNFFWNLISEPNITL